MKSHFSSSAVEVASDQEPYVKLLLVLKFYLHPKSRERQSQFHACGLDDFGNDFFWVIPHGGVSTFGQNYPFGMSWR